MTNTHTFTFILYNDHEIPHIYHYTQTHIFTFILYNDHEIPKGSITIFAYIPDVIWTIQHSTDTLAFEDH